MEQFVTSDEQSNIHHVTAATRLFAMYPSIELLSTLLAAAIQYSGLPAIPVDAMPPVTLLSKSDFMSTVCPENPDRCASMVAAFDTLRYRIVIHDDINLNSVAGKSFLLHELVHVLQYKKDGVERFTSCEAVLDSEREAFAAQNRYLEANDVIWRAGTHLRYMRCPPEGRTGDGISDR